MLSACLAPRPQLPEAFWPAQMHEEEVERPRGRARELRRELRDPETDQLVRSWGELREPGQRARRHGVERLYHPDATLAAERHWEEGEPVGIWRSWYVGGQLESEVIFAGEQESTMRWWHRNGRLAARGPAIAGVRRGAWTFWHPNGVRARAGEYLGGLKHGVWSYWDESGELLARGRYQADRRVGAWELAADEAEPPERSAQ